MSDVKKANEELNRRHREPEEPIPTVTQAYRPHIAAEGASNIRWGGMLVAGLIIVAALGAIMIVASVV